MNEILLNKSRNGMPMLLGILAGMILSIVLIVIGVEVSGLLIGLGTVLMIVAIFLLPGLKVLKPQEALVLTLFGKYVGTLKGEGFYWVNPFCTAVNPAAKTVLNQSGDVKAAAAVDAGMKMFESIRRGYRFQWTKD